MPFDGRRARTLIVDEDDSVPDENLIVDLDAVADERMALDLAVCSDDRAPLNLDEWSDTRVGANSANVEVRERVDDHILTEGHVLDQTIWRLIGRPISHLGRSRRDRKSTSELQSRENLVCRLLLEK